MSARHEVEWTPPPNLDTGQSRVNTHHTPERLLRPPENEEGKDADAQADAVGGAGTSPPPVTTDPSEPGGPAPPDNQVA